MKPLIALLLLLPALALIFPSNAFSQNDSDILEAHSDARREFCDGAVDVGSSYLEMLENDGTLNQVYKLIETQTPDVNLVYIMKLIADIAYQYQEQHKNQTALQIDLLHTCITTSGTLDKAFIALWLEAVPESHPQYSINQMILLMTDEQIEAISGEEDVDLGKDQAALLNAEILKVLPHELTAFDDRNQGVLRGCGLEFALVGQDFAYRLGGLILVKGSIQYMYTDNNLLAMIKVTPYDLIITKDGSTFDTEVFGISYAYLKTPNGNALPKKETAFKCEDGGFCGTIPIENFGLVINAMSDETFSIVYTRTDGASDVEIPVVLERVENTEENLLKNVECTDEFLSMMSEEGFDMAEDE